MTLLTIWAWVCIGLAIAAGLTLLATVLLFVVGRRMERRVERARDESFRAGVKPPKGWDTIYRLR